MQSLAGVFIKSELEEMLDDSTILYPFMLIFPNKRRIYYLETLAERDQWVEKIKQVIGYANLHDFTTSKSPSAKVNMVLSREVSTKSQAKRLLSRS